MEHLIRTPSRQPRSALRISGDCTASGPRPRHGSFLETSWASTDNTATTLPDLPPYRTSVRPVNQPKTARRAGYRSTRNHHQATETGRLETTPVRRPRVGQHTMLLSTPTLTPTHVPSVSTWCYKRKDPGIDNEDRTLHHTQQNSHTPFHTALVFTPVQALRCKIIQTSLPRWT